MLLSPPSPHHAPGALPEPMRDPRPGLGTESRIWLVRHARVSAPDTAYGDDDVPLSEEGQAQTDAVERGIRGLLQPSVVVASPLIRARAMGEAIARGTGAPLRFDPRLKEMNRGAWQGLERTEYAERWRGVAGEYWADPLNWRGHSGESEAMLVERTFPVLQEVAREAAGGVGVIAAHRQVIRCLVAAALGLPPGRSHGLQLDPAHAVLLADTGDRWSLLRTNIATPGAPHMTEPDSGPVADVPTRKP
ncbi:Glucosyl-3-phosphoglycerate phosphatase [Planctomycetes bacterium Poly30]|uniref:Glucosyl-3-phosphoglycerate phosphatase n=1 Tax=Saltatorellus ferox TaxID=2528018 RepID=A0A518EWP9_9BACT|nr:Glucosyl-3-phosphoglycerate phosphatase [Planctomycetes bacterium Poly30]